MSGLVFGYVPVVIGQRSLYELTNATGLGAAVAAVIDSGQMRMLVIDDAIEAYRHFLVTNVEVAFPGVDRNYRLVELVLTRECVAPLGPVAGVVEDYKVARLCFGDELVDSREDALAGCAALR